jgi:chromosome segregation protein
MRLKTLEVKGFKSFANETVIHFSENIIGIVGPNGSGKSNVVDAIRWVLGEQKSSELRLEKMNSVIFAGTKKRKAGQLAQVSLTFENTKNLLPTEYANVTITRILYASGDSEYRLNGVTCRLKDITNLFLDTGIGSNSYAIIALGMVDDILNDKQNSRRMMFEQAAGVSKYKARKTETLNKLNATEEDLNRIEDLLFEIDNNLKTLEKQAKRTQKYFDIKAEYKVASIDLAVLKLAAFKQQYKDTEQNIQRESDRYRSLDIQLTQLDAQTAQQRSEIIAKEQLLSESQRTLNSLVGRIRGMENDKRMAQQKAAFVTQNQAKIREQLQTATAKTAQLTTDIQYYQDQTSAERAIETQLETQLADAKQQLESVRQNHGSAKSNLDSTLQQQRTVENQITELEKQKAIRQNQISNIANEIQSRANETQSKNAEMQTFRLKMDESAQKITDQEQKIVKIQHDENQRKQQLDLTQRQLDELTRQLADTNRQLDAKKNELKLTRSMVESMEGFPESLQFLAKSKQFQAPMLSDVMYVVPEFRTAIENFLEPFLNHYVVQTYDEALKAVRLLSESQKGKANFFILEAFEGKNYQTADSLVARPAATVTQVEAQYQPLVNYLLYDVFIVDNEQLIAQKQDTEGATYLTLNGALARRRYSLKGGSVGLFEGKRIGRKKNMEVLETEIETLRQTVATQDEALKKQKTTLQLLRSSDKQNELQQANNQLSQLRQEQVFLRTRLENFEQFIAEADLRNQTAQQNKTRTEQEITDIATKLTVEQQKITQIKQSIGASDDSFRELSDRLSQLSQVYNESNVAFLRQQNKVATLQRELDFRQRQLADLAQSNTTNQRNLEASERELQEANVEIGNYEQELQTRYKERREREGELGGIEQNFYQTRNQITQAEEQLRKLQRQTSEVQTLVNQLKEQFSDLKLQIAAIGERLQVEFNISVNELINETPKTGLPPQLELQKRVETLKKQLDTFGEINHMAVEAYNEMKGRYDSISEQRNDILSAKTSLLATIEEIETTATKQFMETFDAVRIHFIEIFKSLFFEEDTADLILTDPTNPLESGINIIAKPKGKRPQSIAQLSGGEKTLTATALLFALYLFKPAPFCIFDEVDAPLDDANIEKFNRIIKKFSVDSQFIIITHNKATMAAVDVIYGVHMPEQGVSEVTAVDFRAFKENEVFVSQ